MNEEDGPVEYAIQNQNEDNSVLVDGDEDCSDQFGFSISNQSQSNMVQKNNMSASLHLESDADFDLTPLN